MIKPTVNQVVKTLTAPELKNLQELVEELFAVMDADEEGLLVDLYDRALTAAEILGVKVE